MCEPNHSIVQYPDQDDRGNPTSTMIDAIPSNGDGFFTWAKKKIKSWFHFSKLGKGHSEAMSTLSAWARNRLPEDTKYEAAWWARTVRLDGRYNGGHEFDAAEAFNAAHEYAHRVSLGNMTLLRQFLQGSIQKTDEPHHYIVRFGEMLTPEGRTSFRQKMERLFGISSHEYLSFKSMTTWKEGFKRHLNGVISLMMGFTRKRKLLVSAWADDDKLWVPEQKILTT